jgi:hypothetical protein
MKANPGFSAVLSGKVLGTDATFTGGLAVGESLTVIGNIVTQKADIVTASGNFTTTSGTMSASDVIVTGAD